MSKRHPKHHRAAAGVLDACDRVEALADRRVGRTITGADIIAGMELAIGRPIINREAALAAYRRFEDDIVAATLGDPPVH